MKKIILPSTSIMIEESSTLKCKLCLAYIPYYDKYVNMRIDEVKKILSNYFSIVDEVEIFCITGGEPLLNTNLEQILLEISKYEKYISKDIILITNGTIKISPKILKAFQTIDKMKVIVNNYGEISKYSQENYEILKEYHIKSILNTEDNRHGWINCRDHSLKHLEENSIIKQANSCDFFTGKKYVIKRGSLYTCTRSAYRIQEGIISNNKDDFIDLTDNLMPKEILKERLKILMDLKHTNSCAYCGGLTE